VNAFFDQLLAKLRAIPGVNSASIILPLPLTGSNITTDFDMEEHPLPEGQRNDAPMRITGLDYFETMGSRSCRAEFSRKRTSLIAAGRHSE
jgi:hypothetical protein